MPDEKPRHNIKRIIRGAEPVSVVTEDSSSDNKVTSLFLSYKTKLWDGCKPFNKESTVRKELYEQLVRVVSSLNMSSITYSLYAGTLIGLFRDNNINPLEVDNDLIVPENFISTEDIRYIFFQHGLHFFKDGIYRACNIGEGSHISPWDGDYNDYTTYTDFYSLLPYMQCNSKSFFSRVHKRKIDFFETVQLLNLTVQIPNKILAKECLDTRYGNWHEYYTGESWKVNIHRMYDK